MVEYKEFLFDVLEDKIGFQEKKNIEKLFQIPPAQLAGVLERLQEVHYRDMLIDPSVIVNLNEPLFKMFFLKCPPTIQKELIQNDALLEKIVQTKPNINKRNLYDLVKDDWVRDEFLLAYERIEKINSNFIKDIIDKMSLTTYESKIELLEPILEKKYQIDLGHLEEHSEDVIRHIQTHYGASKEDAMSFLSLVLCGKRNLFFLPKIQNADDFFLYTRFGVLLETATENKQNGIIQLQEGRRYRKKFLEYIDNKPICKLIQLIFEKEKEASSSQALAVAINLYGIFGFDNARKVLLDKFTYITDSALFRASETQFLNERRSFRLAHQDYFFHHDMVDLALEALQKKDAVFFEKICGKTDEQYISTYIQLLENKISILENSQKRIVLEKFLKEEIIKREERLKREYQKNYKVHYEQNNPLKRKNVSCEELYTLFADVKVDQFELDGKGRIQSSKNLNQFLLGNEKVTNDCLLRMVFNKIIPGLQTVLIDVINQFEMITRTIEKTNGKLSIHSLLDVCKATLYHLEPDEESLSLETISKIMRSNKHCRESKEIIFKRLLKLHKESKKKVYSTIPSTKGVSSSGVQYEVLPFGSDKNITAGIDTESCLKVGGKGEELLQYILTTKHGLILSLMTQMVGIIFVPLFEMEMVFMGMELIPNRRLSGFHI